MKKTHQCFNAAADDVGTFERIVPASQPRGASVCPYPALSLIWFISGRGTRATESLHRSQKEGDGHERSP
jgi:hypothetical protein